MRAPRRCATLQHGYHLFKRRFLSFLKPGLYARAEWLFALGLFDGHLRRALFAFGGALVKHPWLLFKKISIQSLLILQPQDVLPNGEQDLCDGCPNRTVHDGRLVPMCRKEAYLRFGDTVTLKKREAVAPHVADEAMAADAGVDALFMGGLNAWCEFYNEWREDETDALVEEYLFHQLAINVGLTDQDFNPGNPEYAFY